MARGDEKSGALFPDDAPKVRGAARRTRADTPLADRVRPRTLAELLGQEEALGEGRPLRRALEADNLPSLILWGPPGSGKTTLAHVIRLRTKHHFEALSAVLSGVKELREVLREAEDRRRRDGRRTILFIDEIHRWNKAQQDALLPHVETGDVVLVGATTENPSFELNAALRSRLQVVRLDPLSEPEVAALLRRALTDERGLAGRFDVDDEVLRSIARMAAGDARRALDDLERVTDAAGAEPITVDLVQRTLQRSDVRHDKDGEDHFNVVSALIKSMRGSDPDAAIYWLARLLEAGDDPLFVLRRLIIFASEDVGNADPRALSVAVDADAAYRRVGMPEGLFPIAHACLYLASCPKSNAVKRAFLSAQKLIEERGALPVPKKLRNPVTGLMRDEGYGADYRYAHDFEGHYVPGETYLPDELAGARFYEPTDQGLEKSIAERLERLRRGGAG